MFWLFDVAEGFRLRTELLSFSFWLTSFCLIHFNSLERRWVPVFFQVGLNFKNKLCLILWMQYLYFGLFMELKLIASYNFFKASFDFLVFLLFMQNSLILRILNIKMKWYFLFLQILNLLECYASICLKIVKASSILFLIIWSLTINLRQIFG